MVDRATVIPSFNRSISFQAQSRRFDADSSLAASTSTLAYPSYESDDVASTSQLPATSLLSSVNSYKTSARSRTRSVGAEGQYASSSFTNRIAKSSLNDPVRGPGTPDITLDDVFRPIKGSPERQSKALHTGLRVTPTRKRSQTEVSSPPPASPSTRPRLASQLRSFLTSFRSQSRESISDAVVDCSETFSQADERRPSQLIMPSARPAGRDGLLGLNSDSPPLTPESEESKELPSTSTSVDESHTRIPHRHHWMTAQALADEAALATQGSSASIDRSFTPSTASMGLSSPTSGRSSPLFSTLSRASSMSTYVPSRPSSSIAMLKMSTAATPHVGILPSHAIEPSGSPSPPEGAATAYWHAQSNPTIATITSQIRTTFNSNRLPNIRPHLPALLFLLTAFIGSTMCVLVALSTLPLTLPNHITDLTLNEIREMSLQLQRYSRSSNKAFAHTLAVLGFFFTWKQSFTVPGSLIMNVVFGAMYGTIFGTIITSLLTAVGGVFCYLLVAPLAPLIRKTPFLNKALDKMQKAMPKIKSVQSAHHSRARQSKADGGSSLWTYLLVLRVLPIVPYGLMNIACSVLRVPLVPYAITLAIGSIPWNACTVQLGDLLVQVVSALDETMTNPDSTLDNGGFHNVPLSDAGAILGDKVKVKAQSAAKAISSKLWNKEMLIKLILMSLISLAPMLLQRWLKRRNEVEGAEEGADTSMDPSDLDREIDAFLEADANNQSKHQEQEGSTQSSWGSSWSCHTAQPSILPLPATSDLQRSHSKKQSHDLQRSHSKKLSEAWNEGGASREERFKVANRRTTDVMTQVDVESRRHPSLKRAVAASRLE